MLKFLAGMAVGVTVGPQVLTLMDRYLKPKYQHKVVLGINTIARRLDELGYKIESNH